MVIKNLENKIKLVLIICSLFLVGCIIICISSIWTARTMVSDAHKKVYVLDGNVPILVHRSTMDETHRDVPPLSLYMFPIGINQKQKECIIAIYQCFTQFFKTDNEFLSSLNWVNFVTLFATILLL